ncbi:glucan endo-1,3-beta-glucosidase 7 [Arachis stenosperma]|uniref:glucan endo-1,3-beta-glucosidase 7 n=1 Tax=Arachis stenosperma TaxID=217475 RepID=UPI0025ACFD9B|nr:glucan endo-1,3-beta-glucosidase 7 [Arachis stenosperma]
MFNNHHYSHTFCVALFFLLLSLIPRSSSLRFIGLTYSAPTATPSPPPPETISAALSTLKVNSLRLEDPDPTVIRTFLYTNVSLFLTVPNYLVPTMASNRSSTLRWLYTHVVPFYPRARITTISVGNAFLDSYPQSASALLPAITNLHLSLRDLGIRKITVSTSFSFVTAISTPFPPSSAQFQEPPGINLIGPLLQFLRDTNSSFLINVYPYNLYRLKSEIPLGIALFQEHPFNFRDDLVTGVRYRNLFDMMIDAVVSAMAVAGYESIPIVVTETGWPSSSTAANEVEANLGYAEIYLKGLVKHLRSGIGTPLLKDGVKEVYVYEMFDKKEGTTPSSRSWGVLYANGTTKYRIDFSSSKSNYLLEGSWINVALRVFLSFLVLVLWI